MPDMPRATLLLLSILVLFTCLSVSAQTSAQPLRPHSTTDWQLKPSLKYDALCLLNALSGDPYYLHYYQAEYDRFHPLFTPAEQAAFAELKRIIKDEGGGIISAQLALYYSTVTDETLPEMIRSAHDSSAIQEALKKTTYWDDDGWKTFEKAQPSLEAALRALQRVGFPEYWEKSAKPVVEQRIKELSADLPKYNVVPVIERHIGPLSSNRILIYLLAYSEPHGIRITGLRFLTHHSYPFKIVLHNAIHEMMHPPYNAKDDAVAKAIDLLGSDPTVAAKVKDHDPSFGYNTAPGYIEEDSVQALEEIISEQFGVGHDPRKYWREQDDGMHVLAAAIYVDYKEAAKKENASFSKWFVRAVEDGELRGEKLKKTISDFYGAGPAQ